MLYRNLPPVAPCSNFLTTTLTCIGVSAPKRSLQSWQFICIPSLCSASIVSGGFEGAAPIGLRCFSSIIRIFPYERHIDRCVHLQQMTTGLMHCSPLHSFWIRHWQQHSCPLFLTHYIRCSSARASLLESCTCSCLLCQSRASRLETLTYRMFSCKFTRAKGWAAQKKSPNNVLPFNCSTGR